MIEPKDLKKWLFLIAILYLLFPRDLIPDFVGRGLGLIDDIALMGFLTYVFRRYAQQYAAQQGAHGRGRVHGARQDARRRRTAFGQQGEAAQGPERDSSTAGSDPHAVLAVRRGASQEEIQEAYRARMREYHPDKVAHLGRDLQELAHHKTLEIQRAYERLKR